MDWVAAPRYRRYNLQLLCWLYPNSPNCSTNRGIGASPICKMIELRYALLRCSLTCCWNEQIACWLAVLLLSPLCPPTASAGSTCDPPVVLGALPMRGSGEVISLQWEAPEQARQFRVWAQWQVPEGEVLRTHETVVDTKRTQLPPSPARWRPLKLSIEIESVCGDGAVSTPAQLRQLQFDARAESACPAVQSVWFDRESHLLAWKGDTHAAFELSFHSVENGQVLSRQEAVGTSATWPALVRKPAVIRLVRACGAVQRSRETFLLVR
jgi:hypothetical protein